MPARWHNSRRARRWFSRIYRPFGRPVRARRLLDVERMRFRVSAWHTSLSTALGLVTLACGGQSALHLDDGDDEGRTGGAGGAAGSTPSGGSSGSTGPTGGVGGTAEPTGGTSGSSGSAGGGIDLSCNDPMPVWDFTGAPTGFVTCDGGFIHRPERVDCTSKVPRPNAVIEPGEAAVANCTMDSDCAGLPYGHCIVERISYPASTNASCVAGCIRDEDCDAGSLCLCGDPVGRCVAASCTLD